MRPTVPTVLIFSDSSESFPNSSAAMLPLTLHHTHSKACVHSWSQDANAQSMQSLTVCNDGWTTVCDGDTRCTAQNLKSRFSPLHSILRQKYRVERFSEGSPTSSLCILRVSEAECQGIKSYARFSASTAQRTNVYVIVKFDTCEADVAAEHSESLSCAYNNSLASSCPTVDSDSL